MEKKIVPTLVNFKKFEIGAILLGLLLLGAASLIAAEPAEKENALKQIASIEKRGVVNFFSSPAEVVYTLRTERKKHPKAWPATYIPRFFMNMATRVVSSVNDVIMLPFYVRATNDAAPLTRHFDLPDYAWEKE